MGAQPVTLLLVHGSVVLLSGILSGIPFWITIIRGQDPATIRTWRVAHSVLIVDGLMMLIAGLTIPYLHLSTLAVWVLVVALILSGYGFVFAFIIGAWKGIRGLTPKPFGFNTILFIGHCTGATGSFIGIAVLIYGLFRAL